LKKKKVPLEGSYHTNHIWISPKHINETRKQLTPEVEKSIMDLVASGSSVGTIQIFIRASHDVNVSSQTIKMMRNEHIDNIVNQVSAHPGGSSVDKLIAFFKNTDNVSCVYLKHKYNSGFDHF
jgi:hypothetical protein